MSDADSTDLPRYASSVPNPDPTARTIATLQRDIAAVREIIEGKLFGKFEVVEAQFAAMSEATLLVRKESDKLPDLIAEKIKGSTDLVNERIRSLSDVTTQQFKSIDDKFAEKDKAVSVGLSAQKESAAAQQTANTDATTKMAENFTKLIDQGRDMLAEVRRNTEIQINDMKDRLATLEGTKTGANAVWGFAVGALGLMIGLAGLIELFSRH